MLTTALTRLLGVRHPIIQAGMGSEAGARLAAAVSNAGGLGTLGSIGRAPDGLAAEMEACSKSSEKPWAVNVVTFEWAPFAEQLVEVAIAQKAPVITLSFGEFGPALKKCQAAGIPALVQVQDLESARTAIAMKADAVMVQGNEAGGHTGRRGTLNFAAQVLDLSGDVPIVVAGGVGTGRGLAAALAMGAAGVVVGTRFKASEEYGGPEHQKAAIVASDGSNTLAEAITDMPLPFEWPTGVVGRLLRSPFTEEWEGRAAELKKVVAAGESGEFYGKLAANPATQLNWAGESSGLVSRVMPAAEIVAEVVREAEELLKRVGATLAG